MLATVSHKITNGPKLANVTLNADDTMHIELVDEDLVFDCSYDEGIMPQVFAYYETEENPQIGLRFFRIVRCNKPFEQSDTIKKADLAGKLFQQYFGDQKNDLSNVEE